MPDRFGEDKDKNGLVDYRTRKDEIQPDKWRVDFTVTRRDRKPCRKGDVVLRTAPGAKFTTPNLNKPCRFFGRFPKEGSYMLQVVLEPGKGKKALSAERTIVVQDWLIFGLGDSNGSGEGAPDIPNAGVGALKWQEPNCHRSANSYQAWAARGIEKPDPLTSVTFVHLACSGATIDAGLLKPYNGIESGKRFAPQIKAMTALAQSREIDAVIISIGVNDLGFGALVAHCIFLPDCQNQPFPDATSTKTLNR